MIIIVINYDNFYFQMTVETEQLNKIKVEIVENSDIKTDRLYQAFLAVISEKDVLELLKNEKND